jgi:hypothetical protein
MESDKMVNFRNPNIVPKVRQGTAAGPNPYASGARPTITIDGLRLIDSINDVQVFCNDSGYNCSVVSVSGNIVTFKVRTPGNQHAHDLITQGVGGAVGAAIGLSAALNSLEDVGAAALHTVPGAGATGVQNAVAAQAAEVADGTNLAALTFTARALGI